MLDIQYIRENQTAVKKAAGDKNLNPKVVDEVLRLDRERKELIVKVDGLRSERNHLSKQLAGKPAEKLKNRAVEIKKELHDLEPQLKKIEMAFNELMLQVPSVPAPDVPVGPDESGNKVVKKWGELPKFSFKPQDHLELGTKLDLIDTDRGVKVGGFRSFFTKNELVLLEYGLLDYALRYMIKQGFTPLTVPWMVNDAALFGTGYFP